MIHEVRSQKCEVRSFFLIIYDNEWKIGTNYYFTELLKVEFSSINCCEYDFFIERLKYDCNQAI